MKSGEDVVGETTGEDRLALRVEVKVKSVTLNTCFLYDDERRDEDLGQRREKNSCVCVCVCIHRLLVSHHMPFFLIIIQRQSNL